MLDLPKSNVQWVTQKFAKERDESLYSPKKCFKTRKIFIHPFFDKIWGQGEVLASAPLPPSVLRCPTGYMTYFWRKIYQLNFIRNVNHLRMWILFFFHIRTSPLLFLFIYSNRWDSKRLESKICSQFCFIGFLLSRTNYMKMPIQHLDTHLISTSQRQFAEKQLKSDGLGVVFLHFSVNFVWWTSTHMLLRSMLPLIVVQRF